MLALPVLLLCCLPAQLGLAQSADAQGVLTVEGIVEAADDTAEVIQFQLSRKDLRFAVASVSAADRAAVAALLHASAQTSRLLKVHFVLAGAQFAPDRKRVVFPVRDLEYDGKTTTARAPAAAVPAAGTANSPAEAAFIRAVGLYHGEKYSEAITELDTAMQSGGDADWKAESYKLRGLARLYRLFDDEPGPSEEGDRQLVAALQDLREWRTLKPDDSYALYRIAETLRELGAYHEALDVYAAIGRGWPEEAYWSAILTGATERQLHHYPQALAALDKLVSEHGPQEGTAFHYHRGLTLAELGRYADAIEEYSQSVRDQPDYAWALVRRACAEELLGQTGAALTDQQAALGYLKRYANGTRRSNHDIGRATEVEAQLRQAGAHRQTVDAGALCSGYWRPDLSRSRSGLLPAELPWMGSIVDVAKSAEAKPKYETGPPAGWVKVAPAAQTTAAGAAAAASSSEFLLIDRQVRIDGASSQYNRFVIRVHNSAGVSDQSQISIQFDPLRQHLRLHSVTVSRGSETVDELKRGRIELLRRESGLDQGLLDGWLTFHLVMDDVRVGDTIDYSYSLERSDALWGNRFYAWYPTNWNEPVAASRLRLMLRAEQPLNFADRGGGAPATTLEDGWRALEWNWHDIPGEPAESGAPAWYTQHKRIEFSQFAGWREVVDATWPLYMNNAPTPELTAQIARFKSQGGSDRERLIAIMRFVQDEVRYTGVELGDGAYRPAAAATVLQRRWGDCKDKTLLAVTLLRGVGIEADPALVNTRLEEHVSEWLPSPADFDHAIVRARLGTSTYWLDATASGQGGDIDSIDQAHYGVALVVRADTTELEPMPPDSAPAPTSAATVVVDMRRGFDKEAVFTVSTVHRGSGADDMRGTLREATAQDLATKFLNFYKQSYPGIRATAPLAIHDDRAKNELRIDEAYAIDKAFEPTEDGAHRLFELEADSLTAYLKRPATTVRTTPLALPFPTNVEQHVRILLPEPANAKDEQRTIAAPAFRYEYRAAHSGHEVQLDYSYRTLADHVPVEQLSDFLAKREEARSNCFYQVTLPAQQPPSEAAVAEAQKQLAAAAQFVQTDSWDKADAAFTALLTSGKLTQLDETKQHAALFLAGLAALGVDDAARAQGLLKRSTDMTSAQFQDWRLRLQAAQAVQDWHDAAYSLTQIAQKWPDTVSELETRQVARTVHELRHLDDDRYQLLKALFAAKFTRPGLDPSRWWRDLALMQIEKGERSAALQSLAALTDPYAMIGVLADNRFRDLRESLPHRLDVADAMRRMVEADYAAVTANPAKLEPVSRLAGDLLGAVRGEEALKVLDAAIAKAGAPEGRKAYRDYDEQYVWLLDTRAHALFTLGRWDDALAQLQAASHLREERSSNVSQVINLAELYDRLQQPQNARNALKDLQPGSLSPFGEMQRTDAALSAALQLGDAAESTRLLDYMREHQEDAIGSYEDALIMADRPDDAAALLIKRLADPEKRMDALMAVQHWDNSGPAGALPRAQELRGRWDQVKDREDVRTALARVGSVGAYPLRSSGAE